MLGFPYRKLLDYDKMLLYGDCAKHLLSLVIWRIVMSGIGREKSLPPITIFPILNTLPSLLSAIIHKSKPDYIPMLTGKKG